ncbi:MAG: LamB/YcsF family protein, partial [Ferruginibacter sp.]
GALLSDAEKVILQVMQAIREGKIRAVNGQKISIKADTICIHGDGLHAVEFAKKINSSLLAAGIHVQKIDKYL